jgi:anaerobic magnesium-protoporphyrin IX monomethyl ester cyclase
VRVLLINPAMNMKKLGRFAGLLEPMPCIGLAYIAAALEEHGCFVRVIDMFAEKLSGQEVIDKTVNFWFDLVGMMVLMFSAPVCSELSQQIRSRLPDARIVWGAIHADVFADDIIRDGDADFCIHHDGEESIVELVEQMTRDNPDYASIDGISWRDDDGQPVKNKDRALNRDLDDLPYPACSRSRTSPSPCSPWPGPAAARIDATTAASSTRGARSTESAIPSRSSTSTSTSWTGTA